MNKEQLLMEFDKAFGSDYSPGMGELKEWLESADIQSKFPGTYDQLRSVLYKLRLEYGYPINKQEPKPDELIPTAEDYARRDRILKEEKEAGTLFWSDKTDQLTEIFLKKIEALVERASFHCADNVSKGKGACKACKKLIAKSLHNEHKRIKQEVGIFLEQKGIKRPDKEQNKEAFSGAVRTYVLSLTPKKKRVILQEIKIARNIIQRCINN